MSKNIKFFETGWSLDLFKEQSKALPFACVVKENGVHLPKVAYTSVFNGDIMCKKCSKPYIEFERSYRTTEMINTLRVGCINERNGCPFDGNINELNEHIITCEYINSKSNNKNINNNSISSIKTDDSGTTTNTNDLKLTINDDIKNNCDDNDDLKDTPTPRININSTDKNGKPIDLAKMFEENYFIQLNEKRKYRRRLHEAKNKFRSKELKLKDEINSLHGVIDQLKIHLETSHKQKVELERINQVLYKQLRRNQNNV